MKRGDLLLVWGNAAIAALPYAAQTNKRPNQASPRPFFYVGLFATTTKPITMFVNVIGYVAGAITALTFLPQVIKTWREKSAKDISLLMFLIAAANEILWIIYGALLENGVIILTNTVVLAMSLTMIFLKLRYNK